MPDEELFQQYLAPSTDAETVVVLTDVDHYAAILLTADDSVALTGASTQVLHEAFFGPLQRTGSIVDRTAENSGDAMAWVREMADAGIVEMSDTRPRRSRTRRRRVEGQSEIAPNPTAGGDAISVESPGEILARSINNTQLFWYESDRSLRSAYGVTVPDTAGAVYANRRFLPARVDGGLGISCTPCAGCAACGGCAGCALCGIPPATPAVAIAALGIDTVLGIVAIAGSAFAAEWLFYESAR